MKRMILAGAMATASTLAVVNIANAADNTGSDSESVAQIRAQMEQLQQEMNQKMAALQQQLNQVKQQKMQDQKKIAAAKKATEDNSTVLSELKKTRVGGTVELQYVTQFDNKTSRQHGGDFDLNKFSLNVSGDVKNFIYDADYRFYPYARLLHYGWFGYKFSDQDNVKLGLIQAPFGNMPYGYMSYYGGIPYYFGFNDNQNAGVVYSHASDWEFDIAFFKNSQLGTTPDHYGSNPVPDSVPTEGPQDGQYNQAINQGDVRLGYTFGKGTDYSTNVAVSGKGGEFYNNATHNAGTNWAAALSVNGTYGNLQAMAQATAYQYNPKNPNGVSNDLIQIGSFAATYLVPAKAQIYQASAGYTIPLNYGILESITVSDDYSYLHTGSGIDYTFNGINNIDDPQANDLGVYWSASPFFAWTDIISGKNFLGFIGKADNKWHNAAYLLLGVTF